MKRALILLVIASRSLASMTRVDVDATATNTTYAINGHDRTFPEFTNIVARLAALSTNEPIVLRVRETTRVGDMVDTILLLRNAGMTNIATTLDRSSGGIREVHRIAITTDIMKDPFLQKLDEENSRKSHSMIEPRRMK